MPHLLLLFRPPVAPVHYLLTAFPGTPFIVYLLPCSVIAVRVEVNAAIFFFLLLFVAAAAAIRDSSVDTAAVNEA